MKPNDIEHLRRMAHGEVRNYVIPGLASHLIADPSQHGTVRMFTCDRMHEESITPHSHRFDFLALVLEGSVTNRIWYEHDDGDAYMRSLLGYGGDMGKYRKTEIAVARFAYADMKHAAGDWYSMKADEIHSIQFARGTKVLMFEGPSTVTHSVILEPWCFGKVVPTFEVRDWMFERVTP